MSRRLMNCLAAAFVCSLVSHVTAAEKEKNVPAALNFKMKSLAGKQVPLNKYQGKVVMIVNVASQCGLTPQYEQLQALHEKYSGKGLAILGFPCNQFWQAGAGNILRDSQFLHGQLRRQI